MRSAGVNGSERGGLHTPYWQRKGGTFAPPHLTLNSNEHRNIRLYHTKGDQSLDSGNVNQMFGNSKPMVIFLQPMPAS